MRNLIVKSGKIVCRILHFALILIEKRSKYWDLNCQKTESFIAEPKETANKQRGNIMIHRDNACQWMQCNERRKARAFIPVMHNAAARLFEHINAERRAVGQIAAMIEHRVDCQIARCCYES